MEPSNHISDRSLLWINHLSSRIDSWTTSLLSLRSVELNLSKEEIRRAILRPLPLLMIYGGAMGSYGLINDPHVSFLSGMIHMLFSSTKIPFLIGLTFFLALPAFYVFYMLAGLSEDFPKVIRSLMATNAVFALALASLTPFTLFFYLCSSDYLSAILFNTLIFGLAASTRQVVLKRQYRHLVAHNARHRFLLRLWFFLYAFIGIQNGWLLRPWIGKPGGGISFFRSDTWSVAYLELLKIIRQILDF